MIDAHNDPVQTISRWADIYKFVFRLTLMTIMFIGLILKIIILPFI